MKLEFLIPCIALWMAYLVLRIVREPGTARGWGLRLDNLGAASIPCAAAFVAGAAGIAGYRWLAGWRPLPASSAAVFALYPVWGFMQQFVLQALLVGNARRLGLPAAPSVALGAILFGVVHLPDWPLVGLCAVAGVAWTTIYLRRPNLVPLALSHAWLGTLAYYWILERDPWGELFPNSP